MTRIAGAMIASLIACFVATDLATGVPPGAEQFQAYGETLQGWWEGYGLSTFNEAGVSQAGEIYSGHSSELWILNKAAVEVRWQSGNVRGQALRFWDTATKRIDGLGIASNGTVTRIDAAQNGEGWDERVHFTLSDGTSFVGSSPRLVSKSGNAHFFEGTNWVSGDKKLPDSWDVWRKVPAPNVPQEAWELMESLVGTWQFEGKFGTEAVSGSITYAWSSGRHCVTVTGTYTDAEGTAHGAGVLGWDIVRKQLVGREHWSRGWSNTFSYTRQDDLLWTGDADCPDQMGNVITAKVSWQFSEPGRYTYRWFDRVDKQGNSQPPMELVFKKLPPAGVEFIPNELLIEYGATMNGEWQAPEIVLAQDLPGIGKKGDKVPGRASCRRILDGAALGWGWQFGGVPGQGMTYWDPATKQLRSIGVDASGTTFEEVITKEDGKYVCRSDFKFPDGKRRLVTDTLMIEDAGETHIHVGSDITLDGVAQDGYRDVWKRANK